MSRHGNLVLTLSEGDVVTIGESTVTYVGLVEGRVRVAIRAPREVKVSRGRERRAALAPRDAEQGGRRDHPRRS